MHVVLQKLIKSTEGIQESAIVTIFTIKKRSGDKHCVLVIVRWGRGTAKV